MKVRRKPSDALITMILRAHFRKLYGEHKSLSVGDESRKAAQEFLQRAVAAGGNNRIAYLDFAAEPGLVHAEQAKESPQLDPHPAPRGA